jgi:hypothetical protein
MALPLSGAEPKMPAPVAYLIIRPRAENRLHLLAAPGLTSIDGPCPRDIAATL